MCSLLPVQRNLIQKKTDEKEKIPGDILKINLVDCIWPGVIWGKKCKSLTWVDLFFQIILLGQLLWITVCPFVGALISCWDPSTLTRGSVMTRSANPAALRWRSHTWQPHSRRLQYIPLRITQRSDKLPLNYKTQEIAKTASLRSLLRQQETVL